MVSTPRRISSLHAATPRKPAPPMTRARVNWSKVAGDEVHVDLVPLAEPPSHLCREHDRPVLTARAPKRDDEMHAALLAIQGHELGHHSQHVVAELHRGRLPEDEFGHRWTQPVEVAPGRFPVRV